MQSEALTRLVNAMEDGDDDGVQVVDSGSNAKFANGATSNYPALLSGRDAEMMIPETLYMNGSRVGQVKPATVGELWEAAAATGYPMPKSELCDAERFLIAFEVLVLTCSMKDATADDAYNYGRARAAFIAKLPAYMRLMSEVPNSAGETETRT